MSLIVRGLIAGGNQVERTYVCTSPKLAHEQFPVKAAPLNDEVALTSYEIMLSHRDPADHFLAATALVYDLTLMRVDAHLVQASGSLPAPP